MNWERNIDELQEKLAGVYDLLKVDDSRKMIDVLLRSILDKSNCLEQTQNQLKMLALMVVNDNPNAIEKAREVMAGSGKSKAELMDFLMGMANTMKEAEGMTNKQIISEVTDMIWSGLDSSSRESAVLGEMIHRMKEYSSYSE
jgi:translation initiation factor 2 alpha subunit (eIF-2alpha)